uniref:PucR family transcriptional regulator n=1 Tax=Nonomuraea lactucae TaxID=2249762 RepID=UPI0013B3B037
RRGDLLRRVLEDPVSAAVVGPQLGMRAAAAAVVAAFIVASDDPGGVAAARAALQLTDLVSLHCEAHYGHHGCALIDGTVYALLPAGSPSTTHKELITHIAGRASRALHLPVRAALGSVVAGLRAAAQSRDDADAVLRVLAGRDWSGGGPMVATIDEVRPSVALAELADMTALVPRLAQGAGPTIRAHDREHGTSYADTLLAYFASDGDVATAAKRLNVHPNTCRYRLARAEEVFGFRLADADGRLFLWLQLRLSAREHSPDLTKGLDICEKS